MNAAQLRVITSVAVRFHLTVNAAVKILSAEFPFALIANCSFSFYGIHLKRDNFLIWSVPSPTLTPLDKSQNIRKYRYVNINCPGRRSSKCIHFIFIGQEWWGRGWGAGGEHKGASGSERFVRAGAGKQGSAAQGVRVFFFFLPHVISKNVSPSPSAVIGGWHTSVQKF